MHMKAFSLVFTLLLPLLATPLWAERISRRGNRSTPSETTRVQPKKEPRQRKINFRRIERHTDDNIGDTSAAQLVEEAQRFTASHQPEMAARRYRSLLTYFPGHLPEEDLLLNIAGLELLAGDPDDALSIIIDFGKRFPDSPKMTHMVELAFYIGKQYTLRTHPDFLALRAHSRAISALEFVDTHDPFSLEAAESLYSMAYLKIKSNEWEEAIEHLRRIEEKQPGTAIAANAEIALAECYLGLNKGAVYSGEFLDKAIFYLEAYLRRYPNGPQREQAQSLLDGAYRRIAIREIQTVRFYCSQRKWTAARFYLRSILEKPELAPVHPEAEKLLAAILDH